MECNKVPALCSKTGKCKKGNATKWIINKRMPGDRRMVGCIKKYDCIRKFNQGIAFKSVSKMSCLPS